jgi:hypothetical protein
MLFLFLINSHTMFCVFLAPLAPFLSYGFNFAHHGCTVHGIFQECNASKW